MSDHMNFSSFDNDLDFLNETDEVYLINTLSDHLLIENIHDQIDHLNIDFIPTDYFALFDGRLKYLEFKYRNNADFIDKLKDIKVNFITNLLKKFVLKYELTFAIDDMNIEQKYILVRELYHFFILNYQTNIIAFFTQFIIEHKRSLYLQFAIKKPSFEQIELLRKIYRDDEGMIICYNLYELIYFILKDEVFATEILQFIIKHDPDNMTNQILEKLFIIDQQVLPSENFKKIFFDLIYNKKDNYMKIIKDIESNCLEIFRKKSEYQLQ